MGKYGMYVDCYNGEAFGENFNFCLMKMMRDDGENNEKLL